MATTKAVRCGMCSGQASAVVVRTRLGRLVTVIFCKVCDLPSGRR